MVNSFYLIYTIESNEKDMMALKLIEAKYFELKYRVTKNTSVQTVEDFHHIPHHQPRKLTIRESSNKVTNLHEVRGEESLNNETHPLIKVRPVVNMFRVNIQTSQKAR